MKFFWTKEVKIGLLFLMSVTMFVFGLNFLKGINLLKPSNYYYLVLDNSEGLAVSAPVKLNGYKVGLVRELEFDYNGYEHTTVVVSLDKQLKLPVGCKMKVVRPFMSDASLELIVEDSKPNSFLAIGDTIPSIQGESLMDQLEHKMLAQIGDMMPKLDSILTGLSKVSNHPGLTQSLDNLAVMTNELKVSSKKLNAFFDKDLAPIADNLEKVSGDLAIVSGNLQKADIAGLLNNMDLTIQSLNTTAKKMQTPDNTLGLLMNDRQLYDNLNATAANASNLVVDLKANPKRYVHFSIFGKK